MSVTESPDRLYELLPAVYRERDAEQGYPLRALLRIVGRQAALVDRDVETLWNDFFVETCRPWVIPYIGDLVGSDVLYDATRSSAGASARELFTDLAGRDLRPPLAARSRTDVAKTISYRRRKGTPPMLEELARDVTGWPAHAVEFVDLLSWTQHLEHRRATSRWADTRSVEAMGRVGGAFDETSHSVDVRGIGQREGWHNVAKVGFFLWRLGAFPLEDVPARRTSAPWRYTFSQLGQRMPIFSRLRREGDQAGLATELHVPGPIRTALFAQDLRRYAAGRPVRTADTELYGETADASFAIRRNGVYVHPAADPAAAPGAFVPQVVCRRLYPWPEDPPAGQVIAVDVQQGRIAVGDGWPDATESIDVSYHYGFGAELGGGPYERGKWAVRPGLADLRIGVKEDGLAPPGAPPVVVQSVADALALWVAEGRPDTIVSILDSRSYELPATIALRNEGWLVLEAANSERPHLRTRDSGLRVDALEPERPGDPDRRASLTLSGILLEGWLDLVGDLGLLRLLHSTLVPGRELRGGGGSIGSGAAVRARATSAGDLFNTQLRIEAAFSIMGELRIPRHADSITLLDCIVDGVRERALGGPGATPGPHVTAERTTVFGVSLVRSLDASETIFTEPVQAERTQEGCVRFSFVPPGSRTPRRYHCQPDRAVRAETERSLAANPALSTAERAAIRERVERRVVPFFTVRRYGQPAYAQLHLNAPLEIRTGAEDGAEMGAFGHVKQPQRESNLRRRLDEYLPFGLEPGIVYVT